MVKAESPDLEFAKLAKAVNKLMCVLRLACRIVRPAGERPIRQV